MRLALLALVLCSALSAQWQCNSPAATLRYYDDGVYQTVTCGSATPLVMRQYVVGVSLDVLGAPGSFVIVRRSNPAPIPSVLTSCNYYINLVQDKSYEVWDAGVIGSNGQFTTWAPLDDSGQCWAFQAFVSTPSGCPAASAVLYIQNG